LETQHRILVLTLCVRVRVCVGGQASKEGRRRMMVAATVMARRHCSRMVLVRAWVSSDRPCLLACSSDTCLLATYLTASLCNSLCVRVNGYVCFFVCDDSGAGGCASGRQSERLLAWPWHGEFPARHNPACSFVFNPSIQTIVVLHTHEVAGNACRGVAWRGVACGITMCWSVVILVRLQGGWNLGVCTACVAVRGAG
jgi:hypothetical protein